MVTGLGDTLSHHPLLAVVSLFGAGVVTSLTPCIYPMIPITAGVITGTSAPGASRARTTGLTLAYVTGLALFYAVLGLVAGLSGSLFGSVSASPWARLVIGNLLLVFALAMLDVFPVVVPARVVQWAAGLGGGSYPAVFLLGATSGIVAAPCGAPAFAAVLTWVASTRSGLLGFVYLLEFWATWCPLCKALEPSLKAAHARYGRTVRFLAIGVGVNQSPASIKRHLTEHPLPFPVLFDGAGTAVRAYEAPTTSYIVVVDKTGTVTYTGTGAEQDIAAALR